MSLHPTLEKVLIASDVAFKELIKTELSLLVELESGFDFDSIEQTLDSHTRESIFGSNLTFEGICSINQLIVHIQQKENIVQEGIFRKSGSLLRQHELQTLLSTGNTLDIDSKFTVHDSCCVLKKFISELPQALLTNALKDYFLQAMKLKCDEPKLNAIRLLILLLPSPNRTFLYDLLMLFASVIQHSKQNLMNSKNIATIFSQHFFLAKEIKLEKLCDSLETITACLEFMIDNAVEIFVPPPQLIRDANIYLQKREQSIREQLMTNGKGDWKNLVSTTNLQAIPCVKFCATGATSYKAKDYTEQHLAELYAQMASMAASPAVKNGKGKKWIKKFNKENGFGTPMLVRHKEQQELIKESLKKSAAQKKGGQHNLKSFGSAIKRRFLPTPTADKILKRTKTPPKRRSSLTNSVERKSFTRIPIPEPVIGKTPDQAATVKVIFSPRSITPVKSKVETLATNNSNKNSEVKKVGVSQSESAIPISKLRRRSSLYPVPEDLCKQINENLKKRFSCLSANSLQARNNLAKANYSGIRCPRNSKAELEDVITPRKVKDLASKFESMSRSSINERKKNEEQVENGSDDETYVCLNTIGKCSKDDDGTKVASWPELNDSRLKKILTSDPNTRISFRKSRYRKPLIIEQHTAL